MIGISNLLNRCIVKGYDLVLASTGSNIIPIRAGGWSQKTPSDHSAEAILSNMIEKQSRG